MAAASCNPRYDDDDESFFFPMAYDDAHPCNRAGAAYFGASPAVSYPPPGSRPALLDVFECLSDEGAPAAVPAAGTFGTPPPMPVEQLVPDAAAGYGHPRHGHVFGRAAGDGARSTAGRIAFRTRSDEEVLDDGYRWRKYGKKSVKNSPNPRNYYRCSTEGCNVKKRVERDGDDPSYVVTMYEGVHNHVSAGTVYYATQDAAPGRFFVAGMRHPAS